MQSININEAIDQSTYLIQRKDEIYFFFNQTFSDKSKGRKISFLCPLSLNNCDISECVCNKKNKSSADRNQHINVFSKDFRTKNLSIQTKICTFAPAF